LLVGGDKMQRAVQIPQVLVTAVLGLVVLFVVGSEILSRRRVNRRVSTGPDELSGAKVEASS